MKKCVSRQEFAAENGAEDRELEFIRLGWISDTRGQQRGMTMLQGDHRNSVGGEGRCCSDCRCSLHIAETGSAIENRCR